MPPNTVVNGWFDVTDYGALGDGVNDDGPAIQAAETACETPRSNGAVGGVVYFPPGRYLIKGMVPTIQIAVSGVEWRGAGDGASIIETYSGSGGQREAPTVLQIGSAVDQVGSISLVGLRFEGNGVIPSSGRNAAAIIFGASGAPGSTHCKVVDCSFTMNTGPTLQFFGYSDVEISGCRFDTVGYNDGLHSGDNYVTPAVWVADQDCFDFRIHRNHFVSCLYDGVRMQGVKSEISFNYFDTCWGSAIDFGNDSGDGNDVRTIGNYITNTKIVAGGNNQAIYVQHVENFIVLGNSISLTEGDGIAGGGCAGGLYVANLVFDNNLVGGDCGIQYIGQKSASTPKNPNQTIAFVANACYDRQSTPTQQYGMHLFTTSGDTADDFVLAANAFSGNTKQSVATDHDIVFDDDNVAIVNVGWLDRQHATGNDPVNAIGGKKSLLGTAANPIPSIPIEPDSIREKNGLRIVAMGVTIGTASTKDCYLGLSVSSNLFTITGLTGAHNWEMVAYIFNQGTPTSQRAFVQFWYGGVLQTISAVSTSIDTTVPAEVIFEGLLGSSSDSIQCNAFLVERV